MGNKPYRNPLTSNEEIKGLRRAHRVHLSKLGIFSVKAKLSTACMICDHATKFWYNGNDEDILLHAIFVVGLNPELRFDEIGKLTMKYASITYDIITLRIERGVKNQAGKRNCKLIDWPGDTPLRSSLLMDPKVALLSWLTVRGPNDGYFHSMRSEIVKVFVK